MVELYSARCDEPEECAAVQRRGGAPHREMRVYQAWGQNKRTCSIYVAGPTGLRSCARATHVSNQSIAAFRSKSIADLTRACALSTVSETTNRGEAWHAAAKTMNRF